MLGTHVRSHLQTCQRILTEQSFSPPPLKDYLQRYKLLSIYNTPCLYLNSKQELQDFASHDPFCQGLQVWALSSPPKVTRTY
ncbi:hypothetical protein [Helicobacter salomonis]|uniref:hypothetical protein n=1 Tax=Helicobacter salomonis TaxID=56878 RepID=UPI000CF18F46|nr:hypothetical protein [Helicobacter salomonis]